MTMKTRRHPITASRLARLSGQLTVRERGVLDVLGIVQVMTTDQLARIVFPDASPATNLRLARRILQGLRDAGLVRRFDDRAWDRRVGAPGYVHALTAAGLRLVGSQRGIGTRQRKSWRPSYPFLSHRLGISELYARLVEHEHAGGAIVREFRAEADAWRPYQGLGGARLTLKPDALVRIGVDGIEVSHFVEVDRGTETSPATIAAKCEAYRRYEQSGEEVRRHGVFPGVLFIVPNAQRAQAIAAVIARQPSDAQELFAVVTEDEAVTVLTRVEVPTLADRAPPGPSRPHVGMPTAPH